MDLSGTFALSVEKHPTKTAVFWGDVQFSYGQLLSDSRAVAQRLTEGFGVRPGDRVGIWLKNCPEFIPALFGILHAGAVVVPINSFLKPGEVSYMLKDADIQVLIT